MSDKSKLPTNIKDKLADTVKRIFQGGRGLLAVDERPETLGKKFESNGIKNTVENRKCFREMLFKTEGIENIIGGVIMSEETIVQNDESGVPLTSVLKKKGIIVGVKLDKGLAEINAAEHTTVGEEDLDVRLKNAVECGAEFAKWRSVFQVSENCPSSQCIEYNLRVLGQFVLSAQVSGLVPVVEPEISFEGSHLMDETENTAMDLYTKLIEMLYEIGAFIPGIILKLSFISPGKMSMETLTAAEVGRRNVRILDSRLPENIGGVMFLSGGHPQDEVLEYLGAVKRHAPIGQKHNISFSFARAITNSVMETWKGKPENIPAARVELVKNLLACRHANGEYEE
ncbi:fructose-bisphosphate aldolase, class I [Pancytospora epiphaga]|nr:fructose-bisphosphate aldolase, class I [Pancytospora epiphaga]